MFPQRSLLRASQRVGASIHTPAIRTNIQRRLASSNTPPLTGAADNAFNRERQAVKAHAAATSVPHRIRLLWRDERLTSASVTIPCLIIAGVNAWALWNEHWEHEAHMPPLEERPEYPYMNIRTKKFPWGDGDKTLL
ncbi:Cytochrome c oxidase subunit 6A, mitochondrial [Varicellaria rhodocarpa]|nr:Cytochrome c oxidase subunit 6A, mitochondrial [Varicellaria rhodocarpa]